MLVAHTASFLKLINTTLEDISRGVASPHHLHNVRCGIENILCLLTYNAELAEKADQLSRRAGHYVTYHDLIKLKVGDGTTGQDGDRLRAVREALDRFRSAVEHSQPNSRVRTLGLA
jgi:L-alanine-DL-glutamate epimerase-like enolase superfamily enzyme